MDRIVGEKLLLQCVNIFEQIDLPFFLSYGTALGVYRDGGFTPTEVDIDFGFRIEDFVPKVPLLVSSLVYQGFEIETLNPPFSQCWAVKARKFDIGVDMVATIPWNCQTYNDDCRFEISAATLNRRSEFCGVYPKELVESVRGVSSFGRQLPVPNRIEMYLRLLYDDWKTPRLDHTHKHRIDQFRQTRGIPNDLLDQYKG